MDKVPKKPQGLNARAFFFMRVWDLLFGGMLPIKGKGNCKVEWESGYYWISAAPQAANGISGWFWKKGNRKYDPTNKSYSVNEIVKIRSTDSMATTGIVCAGSVTQKATPGLWVALQSVSKLKNDGTDNASLIPQYPLPSGDNDPDSASNYWELIRPEINCV